MRLPETVRGALRATSDWVDLQWSLLYRALEAVASRAGGKLLDVGCGEKQFERIFRPHVDEYLGIEHETAFERTAAKLARSRPDYLYEGDQLPFNEGSFDTVLSIQVLERTPNPRKLVAEMARVLKKGGTLILAAPFSFRLHLIAGPRGVVMEHHHRFERKLVEVFSDGFKLRQNVFRNSNDVAPGIVGLEDIQQLAGTCPDQFDIRVSGDQIHCGCDYRHRISTGVRDPSSKYGDHSARPTGQCIGSGANLIQR